MFHQIAVWVLAAIHLKIVRTKDIIFHDLGNINPLKVTLLVLCKKAKPIHVKSQAILFQLAQRSQISASRILSMIQHRVYKCMAIFRGDCIWKVVFQYERVMCLGTISCGIILCIYIVVHD